MRGNTISSTWIMIGLPSPSTDGTLMRVTLDCACAVCVSVCTWYGWHAMHAVIPHVGAYLPMVQFVQPAAAPTWPSVTKRPGGQRMHCVFPVPVAARPAGQTSHVCCPVMFVNVPAAHRVQELSVPLTMEPAGHRVHVDAEDAANEPK